MELINNKTCAILAHGRSLEELEKRIDKFKDLDIVWCGMNYFNPSEDILKKINKEFTVVFDCSTPFGTYSTSPPHLVEKIDRYELRTRLPRLTEYLQRPAKNIYVTLRDNLYDVRNKIGGDFNDRFKEKIIYGEDLGFDTKQFCVSIHLYIACLLKLGANNIILFGADGGGTNPNTIESYYRPDLFVVERTLCESLHFDMVSDNVHVNNTFGPIMQQIFSYIPEIINCSHISNYTTFKKTNYDETIDWLKNKMKE